LFSLAPRIAMAAYILAAKLVPYSTRKLCHSKDERAMRPI